MKSIAMDYSPQTSKIFFLFLFFSLILVSNSFANDGRITTSVNFFEGDFNSAQAKAGNEGKLFFLDFHAQWCMPCKWMDQTTFNDGRVADIMNDGYVAIKMDIDETEGFNLKNKYDVQYLPTMLIFNSAGKLIDRIEETMPANKLLSILESHNNPQNRVTVTHMTNSAPGQNTTPSSTIKENQENKELLESYSTSNNNRTFRLQMGVFDEYEYAFKEVNALRDEFVEPIIVLNDYHNGGVRYKIMMGEFESISEAESFRVIVKRDFGREAIVQ